MTTGHSTAIDVPATGAYRISPDRSKVAYTGRHRFNTGTVHATFAVASGDLRVLDPLADSTVSVTVDAASFTSDSARRDKDVRSAGLLDVATYPEITFASDRLQEVDDGWLVTGTITAHGHSAPVEVLIDRVTREAEGFTVHGHARRVDRYALGVTKGKGMVGRYLDLEIDALAVPA